MNPVVKSLHYYPVKSCRGAELEEARIDERGIVHDRSWLIVNGEGLAITQRDFSKLALLETRLLDDSVLRLSAAGMDDIEVHKSAEGREIKVRVWDDDCRGVDQGDHVAEWLKQFLGVNCRIVTMMDKFVRGVDKNFATGEQQVGFADGFPFLLISEASLNDLNSKLEAPVLMNRFRPNIVVSGCEPFAEDIWKSICINGVVFDVVKPCARCVIVSIDQEDATPGKEPLRTLSGYRKVGKNVMFGQNLVHHSPGIIRVGDQVELIK